MDLQLDEDMLKACVQCGLCLTSCPTYQVTGDETKSPRGRIALMRHVQDHDAPVTEDVLESFSTCIQCRGCEPACPSDVQFGHLMERTRETLAHTRLERGDEFAPWWLRAAFAPLSRPRLLRLGSSLLGAVQKVVPLPSSLGLPRDMPIRREALEPSGDDVWLFTGCVMDAWQRDVHAATKRVLEAAGFGVRPTGDAAPCCGALQAHAGLADQTRELASHMMATLDDDRPILVDSAGCGAAMKDYGHLLGTDEAAAFAARVFDVQEFLAEHVDQLPEGVPVDARVAIQDPCHLRHVQRVHAATRTVLAPFVPDLVELDDDGLCCGAGGAYSVLQPGLAGDVRELKLGAIERAGPSVVASANPGCAMHLGAAGVTTAHPMEIVDASLRRADPGQATSRESYARPEST